MGKKRDKAFALFLYTTPNGVRVCIPQGVFHFLYCLFLEENWNGVCFMYFISIAFLSIPILIFISFVAMVGDLVIAQYSSLRFFCPDSLYLLSCIARIQHKATVGRVNRGGFYGAKRVARTATLAATFGISIFCHFFFFLFLLARYAGSFISVLQRRRLWRWYSLFFLVLFMWMRDRRWGTGMMVVEDPSV